MAGRTWAARPRRETIRPEKSVRLIPSDPDVETVIRRIRDRSLDLQPEFQRGSVWSRPKQRLLIDSILRNWYVPPVHVVRTANDAQEVLDGQQRLRAISDFVNGHFAVDGDTEPRDVEIEALDGLHYQDLPEQVRRRFDRFTLRTFELIDYAPEEPYELFFRLNQPTTLTAAEKRNAFYGGLRDQIKELTSFAEANGMTSDRIGFSNARLAYEEIIARFLITLERGKLTEKVTANKITQRYRSLHALDDELASHASTVIARLFSSDVLDRRAIRFNKATAYSWLIFFSRALTRSEDRSDLDAHLFDVESARLSNRALTLSQDGTTELLAIYIDRASARVNDVSSVLLRDVALWLMYGLRHQSKVSRPLVDLVLADPPDSRFQEDALVAAADEIGWGAFR